MTVTFFSNFLLHHQLPFCDAMYKQLGDGFKFVATSKIPQERLDLGYKDLSHEYPYSINSYEDENSLSEAKRLANESDVVIIGAAPQHFFNNRLDQDKLTFRYTERLFKNGKWRIIDPRVAKSLYGKHTKYRKNKNYYLMCASAYTAPDCRFIHSYKDKMLKWGYFPPIQPMDENAVPTASNEKSVKLMWVGRFISLKNPAYPIKCLKYLLDKNYDVSLDMIGTGELDADLKKLAYELRVSDKVNFRGAMPTDEVPKQMKNADVFLFTSNREEGWGAVLNEAMSSGCAVVASSEIGSVPFLLNDRENGLIYNGSFSDLCNKTEQLIIDRELRGRLAKGAMKTVYTEWHPNIATQRLIELSQKLMQGSFEPYKSGPCSLA